jgi:hypothetical protein
MVGTLFSMMIYGKQSFSKALGWFLLTSVGTAIATLIFPFSVTAPIFMVLANYMIGWLFVKGFLKEDPKNIGGKAGTGYFNIFLLGFAFNVIIVLLLLVVLGLSIPAILTWLGVVSA